jgi:hypothetical protein
MNQVLFELEIKNLSVDIKADVEFRLFWEHFSFLLKKPTTQKSEKFKNNFKDLSTFKTELKVPVPLEIEAAILSK